MKEPKVLESIKKFNPLYDYCLVQPIVATMTKGGIALPQNMTDEDLVLGKVLRAGPGIYKDNGTFVVNPVKDNDLVYYRSKMKPFAFKLDGETVICLAARDIVATEGV